MEKLVLTPVSRSALWMSLLCGLSFVASAQTVPNAGLLLQENRPAPAQPQPTPQLPAAQPLSVQPAAGNGQSAAVVVLKAIEVQEVPGINMTQLRAASGLDEAIGQPLQLEGLQALSQQVTAYLRSQGLMLARAWLPQQDLSQGVLQINVLEGRYGNVQVNVTGQVLDAAASSTLASDVQRWLQPLQPGEVITQEQLYRRLLLLSDLPGIKAQPRLSRGSDVGQADLQLDVQAQPRLSGRVGVDNFGSRYTGRQRVSAGLGVQPGWVFGDQATLDVLGTAGNTWQAAGSYSLPLGINGWRLQTQLSHTYYKLGKEFAALKAHGTANTVWLGLSYPLVRTQSFNLRTSMGWQHRSLKDVREATSSTDRKKIQAAQLSLSADWLQSHAVTWGIVSLNSGKLSLGDAQRRLDATTARSEGHYSRFNLDAARLQAVSAKWEIYGRLSAQWASKNLSDAEKMVLGGATGVRAWPVGEAVGDRGWLGQLELRFKPVAAWQPYVFVDAGAVHINESPWSTGNNRRSIAGRGVGVRYEASPFKIDLAVARRNGSSASQADPGAGRTRAWLSAMYQF